MRDNRNSVSQSTAIIIHIQYPNIIDDMTVVQYLFWSGGIANSLRCFLISFRPIAFILGFSVSLIAFRLNSCVLFFFSLLSTYPWSKNNLGCWVWLGEHKAFPGIPRWSCIPSWSYRGTSLSSLHIRCSILDIATRSHFSINKLHNCLRPKCSIFIAASKRLSVWTNLCFHNPSPSLYDDN